MQKQVVFKCQNCNWSGQWWELENIYVQNLFEPDDIFVEVVCPECESNNIVEVEADERIIAG